jgi:hypothetical protein
MRTGQLIALWYGVLAIVAVLLVQASDSDGPAYLIAAIGVLTGLVVYTLMPHPNARKKLLLLAIALPTVGIPSALFGAMWWQSYKVRRQARAISVADIDLEAVTLRRDGLTYLVGKLRNRSPHVLQGLTLEIVIRELEDVIERATTECSVLVPPGEARELRHCSVSLSTDLFAPGARERYSWSFRTVSTRGRAIDLASGESSSSDWIDVPTPSQTREAP